jgi:hypothetical protein
MSTKGKRRSKDEGDQDFKECHKKGKTGKNNNTPCFMCDGPSSLAVSADRMDNLHAFADDWLAIENGLDSTQVCHP